jgi:hypothetical protein
MSLPDVAKNLTSSPLASETKIPVLWGFRLNPEIFPVPIFNYLLQQLRSK